MLNIHDPTQSQQCYSCDTMVTIYESKKESKLQDFVETSRISFDHSKPIIGLGNKKKLIPTQKQRKSMLKRIDLEKDEVIKRELRKGNIVNIIL